MKWLDRISIMTLAIITIPLALAPFYPEPHLIEKLRLLFSGQLVSLIDNADLVMHGTPLLILLLKLVRTYRKP